MSLFCQVDIVIRPPVGDVSDGFVDRSPWLQACLFWIGRVSWCWERGQSFARTAEMDCQQSDQVVERKYKGRCLPRSNNEKPHSTLWQAEVGAVHDFPSEAKASRGEHEDYSVKENTVTAYKPRGLFEGDYPGLSFIKQVEDSEQRRRVHVIVLALDRMCIGKELTGRRKVTNIDLIVSLCL